jgi:hypothetical protein
MDAPQMICHCADQIKCATGELTPRDIGSWLMKNIVKYLAIYVIQIPKGKVKTVRELDQEKGGTNSIGLEQDKTILINLIKSFPHLESIHPHPAFGKMTKKQWGILIYKHLDHHLQQFAC